MRYAGIWRRRERRRSERGASIFWTYTTSSSSSIVACALALILATNEEEWGRSPWESARSAIAWVPSSHRLKPIDDLVMLRFARNPCDPRYVRSGDRALCGADREHSARPHAIPAFGEKRMHRLPVAPRAGKLCMFENVNGVLHSSRCKFAKQAVKHIWSERRSTGLGPARASARSSLRLGRNSSRSTAGAGRRHGPPRKCRRYS